VLSADFARFLQNNFDFEISDNSRLYRIECYDISNLFGKQATGSMVVFEGGISAKDQYRRFKIKTVKKISDFDMIEEVFRRRFLKKDWRLPDLIVVDGGTPQLRKVSLVLKEYGLQIPHIGIAKNPDRIIFPNNIRRPIKLQTPKPIFNLICEIRDEAHRFAKKYHLFLRSQKIMV
jgi:excinuclease ABC subunit C